ncbi:MAG: hypothetical protein RMJ54_16985 [Roseiflexaceae bacterium]|nr:hypothetical protein [Roseiflexus sp.]MDW8234471.1 hypothetical protein [Roseiflexaceae bacterium]
MIRSLEQPQFAGKTAQLLRQTRFAVYGELLILAILVAFCAAYLVVVQRTPLHYSLDKARDRLDGSGWYGIEQHGALTYRWSAGSAEVRLPLRHNSGRNYLATMTARSLHPEGPQPIRFFLNDELLAEVTPDREARTYRLLLAPTRGDAGMRFGFATRPFRPADDKRDLGLLVSRLVIQSIPTPDWTTTLGIPAGLLVLWGGIRRRAARWPALAIVAIHALAVTAAATLYRPTALPFVWFAFPALAAAAASVFVAQATPARIGLAALAALVGYSGVIWPLAFTDDAFISFHYARNLVAGHGLVFNPGERVEGYTNFLWTMLAALTIWLGGDPVFWGYAAGIGIGLAIVLVVYRVGASLISPAWGLAAALLTASSQSLLVYTARGAGMETGFFALLILLGSGVYLSAYRIHSSQRYIVAGVIFALAALTRPEGVMVFGLTVGHALIAVIVGESHAGVSLIHNVRLAVRSALPFIGSFLGLFAPYFAWRWQYYGDLLPNTFYAKTGGGVQQWLRGLDYGADFALVFGGPLLLLAAAAPLAALADRSSRSAWRAALTTPAGYLWLLCAAYTAYVIYVGGDHFPGERFFAPIIPWLSLLIVTGLSAMTLSAAARRTPRLAYATATIAVAVAAWFGLNRGEALERRVVGNDESVWMWADLGTWLNRNTPPDASVAAAGIGAIAYYSQRETIDLHGLTDRHIARVTVENMGSGAAGHEKRDPEYVLNVRKPTYIPRFWEDYFGGATVLQQQYEVIAIRTERGYDLQLWRRLPTTP